MTRSVVPFLCSFTTVPILTGELPFRNISGDLKCSSVTHWFRPSIRIGPRGPVPCAGQVVHAGDRCQHTGRVPVLSHDCGFDKFRFESIIGNAMAGLAAARISGRKGGSPREIDDKKVRFDGASLRDTENCPSVNDAIRQLKSGRTVCYRYNPQERIRELMPPHN